MSLIEIQDKYAQFRIPYLIHSIQKAYLEYQTLKNQKKTSSIFAKSIVKEISQMRMSVSYRLGKLDWFPASMFETGLLVLYTGNEGHSYQTARVICDSCGTGVVKIQVEGEERYINAEPKNLKVKYLHEPL